MRTLTNPSSRPDCAIQDRQVHHRRAQATPSFAAQAGLAVECGSTSEEELRRVEVKLEAVEHPYKAETT